VQTLENLAPNGIRQLLGDEITIEGTARLIATFIYMATVEHEILGTGLWNYQMWPHIQPVRVYKNGQREPLDVYQRLVNANFNLNVSRAQLLQDFRYHRGRTASYPTAPAQIPACGITAPGSST
jgi:arachidonate 15-lipoxygenase